MNRFLFILLISFVFAGCSPISMDKMEEIDYTVLQWENGRFSDIYKFLSSDVGDDTVQDIVKLLFFLDKNITFRITALEYTTVDPNNHPIKASGLVFHPLNRKSRGVFDSFPTAHIGGSGPSDVMYAVEGVMVFLGYTVIVPDLLGFGVSKETMSPFLMTQNTGRVAYDMRRAAAQYLWDEFRFELPTETTIMGYSLGGSAALSAQKFYETYHANTVKVKEVHAGGGAYDLPVAFATFSKTGFSDYPSIPNAFLAFDHYYHLNIDFEQVFTGALLDHYHDWYSGSYTLSEMMEHLGSNLHAYLHPDFFKPFDQQNDEIKKIHPFLAENSVSEGWRPKAPVYLSHARVDTYVPVECAQAAVSKFRKAGANVSLTLYPGTHNTVGYHHFVRMVLHFL